MTQEIRSEERNWDEWTTIWQEPPFPWPDAPAISIELIEENQIGNLSDQEAVYKKSLDTGIDRYDWLIPLRSLIKISPMPMEGMTNDPALAFKVAQRGNPSINKTFYCCIKSGQAEFRFKIFTHTFLQAHESVSLGIAMRPEVLGGTSYLTEFAK